MELYLKAPHVHIGYTILRNLTVNPGDNNITCQSFVISNSPESKSAINDMISDYVNGIPRDVEMTGTKTQSTSNPFIQESISYLNLSAPMNGLEKPLLLETRMKLNPFKAPFTKQGQAQFRTENPFDETLTITKMKTDVVFRGQQLAAMDVDMVANPVDGVKNITVPARSTIDSVLLPVTMDNPMSKESLAALKEGIDGGLLVDIDGQLSVFLGEYAADIRYIQKNATTNIDLL